MAGDLLPCPCCGWRAFESYGSFAISDVCAWEDDDLQLSEPEYPGGANRPSLLEAQRNVVEFGAKERRFVNSDRGARPTDVKDPAWRAYDPALDGDAASRPFPYWLKA